MSRILLCAAVLALTAACKNPGDPSFGLARRSCETTLSVKLPAGTGHVFVSAAWNTFSLTQDELARQADGSFAKSFTLPPGDYGYSLYVDGVEQNDPGNGRLLYGFDHYISLLRVPDCQVPLLKLTDWSVDPAIARLDARIELTDGAAGHGLDATGVTVTVDETPITATLDLATTDGGLGVRPGSITLHADHLGVGKHVVRVNAVDRAGGKAHPLYLPLWIDAHPFSWNGALLYFAMVDRFEDHDPSNDHPVPGVDARANFQGGDFAGVQHRLDSGWFDALGVRAIWLSAPNLQPTGSGGGSDGRLYSGYHGYWPASATDVDPRWGTEAELKSLIDTAHAHGIRVLIDFVANHVHVQHPWWIAHPNAPFFDPLALPNGGTCICGAGCSYDIPAEREKCWFADYLPDIDYRDGQAVQAQEAAALHWTQDLGADGLRVDAVKHFAHAVGRALRATLHEELEQTGVDTYLVGETFTGSWTSNPGDGQNLIRQYVSGVELHGQFDFPLMYELDAAFARESNPLTSMESVLAQEPAFYGPGAIMSPFIGNHDLARFMSRAAGQDTSSDAAWNNPPQRPTDDLPWQRQRLALSTLMTLPGAPLLYYGDEIGMPGAADPDNRRMMRFDNLVDEESQTLALTQRFGLLRRDDRVLQTGGYRTLLAENDVLLFARPLDGVPARIVGINRTGTEQTRTVALAGSLGLTSGLVLKEAIGGATATVGSGQVTLVLPPRAVGVWQPASTSANIRPR